MKEVSRPLGIKSESIVLRGLHECQMEFVPDTPGKKGVGHGVLRLTLPENAHIQFQCSCGKFSSGPLEHKGGACGKSSIDVQLGKWEKELLPDGSLDVVLEVLHDYNDRSGSLARMLYIESP